MRDRRSSEVANGAEKVGQGRRKELREKKGKGSNCRPLISCKLFKCFKKHRLEDEGTRIARAFDFKDRDDWDGSSFKMKVKMNYDHNHEVTTCDAWNFLEVDQEPKQRCFELFPDAFFPSKARLAYITEMIAKLGDEDWFKISANPDSRTVFNLYTSSCPIFVII